MEEYPVIFRIVFGAVLVSSVLSQPSFEKDDTSEYSKPKRTIGLGNVGASEAINSSSHFTDSEFLGNDSSGLVPIDFPSAYSKHVTEAAPFATEGPIVNEYTGMETNANTTEPIYPVSFDSTISEHITENKDSSIGISVENTSPTTTVSAPTLFNHPEKTDYDDKSFEYTKEKEGLSTPIHFPSELSEHHLKSYDSSFDAEPDNKSVPPISVELEHSIHRLENLSYSNESPILIPPVMLNVEDSSHHTENNSETDSLSDNYKSTFPISFDLDKSKHMMVKTSTGPKWTDSENYKSEFPISFDPEKSKHLMVKASSDSTDTGNYSEHHESTYPITFDLEKSKHLMVNASLDSIRAEDDSEHHESAYPITFDPAKSKHLMVKASSDSTNSGNYSKPHERTFPVSFDPEKSKHLTVKASAESTGAEDNSGHDESIYPISFNTEKSKHLMVKASSVSEDIENYSGYYKSAFPIIFDPKKSKHLMGKMDSHLTRISNYSEHHESTFPINFYPEESKHLMVKASSDSDATKIIPPIDFHSEFSSHHVENSSEKKSSSYLQPTNASIIAPINFDANYSSHHVESIEEMVNGSSAPAHLDVIHSEHMLENFTDFDTRVHPVPIVFDSASSKTEISIESTSSTETVPVSDHDQDWTVDKDLYHEKFSVKLDKDDLEQFFTPSSGTQDSSSVTKLYSTTRHSSDPRLLEPIVTEPAFTSTEPTHDIFEEPKEKKEIESTDRETHLSENELNKSSGLKDDESGGLVTIVIVPKDNETTFTNEVLKEKLSIYISKYMLEYLKHWMILKKQEEWKYVSPDNVHFVGKTPTQLKNYILTSFYVSNPKKLGNFKIYPNAIVLKSLELKKEKFEQELNLNISSIIRGPHPDFNGDYQNGQPYQSRLGSFEPLVIALVIVSSIFLALIVIGLMRSKCCACNNNSGLQDSYQVDRENLKEVHMIGATFERGQDLTPAHEIFKDEAMYVCRQAQDGKFVNHSDTCDDKKVVISIFNEEGCVVPFSDVSLNDNNNKNLQDSRL